MRFCVNKVRVRYCYVMFNRETVVKSLLWTIWDTNRIQKFQSTERLMATVMLVTRLCWWHYPNISKLSSTHFVSSMRHQHRCSVSWFEKKCILLKYIVTVRITCHYIHINHRIFKCISIQLSKYFNQIKIFLTIFMLANHPELHVSLYPRTKI